MQTNLPNDLLATKHGHRANEILRKCVHCGFCNATCPTYQLSGDELEGPRGRIYLIKEMLEGNDVSHNTLEHLDSCLTCLNCETTCPSGVNYGELAEIGKQQLDNKKVRSYFQTFKRWLLCQILPYPNRFKPIYSLAKNLNYFTAPKEIKVEHNILASNPQRKVILLKGCVQSVISPCINKKLEFLLNQLNIATFPHQENQCCHALQHHNGMQLSASKNIKKTIDNWWPLIESGYDAIVITASGCGSMIKDYARLLSDDKSYAEKARMISEMTYDASEFLSHYQFKPTESKAASVAFHPPCTLQHDQKITGVVEKILSDTGYNLLDFTDKHLCCGSAGTYSILQPIKAKQLRDNKIASIEKHQPDFIATANIGCQFHLQQGTNAPIKHWLELITL